jgi:uncharacterized protein YpmS
LIAAILLTSASAFALFALSIASAAFAVVFAFLLQKEPEDFSADEKEAAQAVINDANAATLSTNQDTLADGITANIKTK